MIAELITFKLSRDCKTMVSISREVNGLKLSIEDSIISLKQ